MVSANNSERDIRVRAKAGLMQLGWSSYAAGLSARHFAKAWVTWKRICADPASYSNEEIIQCARANEQWLRSMTLDQKMSEQLEARRGEVSS